MSKKEIIWREILFQATENKKLEFTQKELAEKFGISTSTVFNALKIPRQSGAIKVGGRKFTVVDLEKFLYIWATRRNLDKETIYRTSAGKNPQEIEGMMPDGAIFSGCGAYAQRYGEAPADYDKIYVYADEEAAKEIKKRFPPKTGYENLFVLKSDPCLKKFGNIAPDVQIFADLWNLTDWYSKEFLSALKRKIFKQ